MSLEQWIVGILMNFSLIMLIAAVATAIICAFVNRKTPRGHFVEQLFRWTALLAAGITGLYTFVAHVFFPERTAQGIGWQTSPFQYEVGMADLASGVLGVLAFWGNFGFRLAATIGIAVWLWGDAVGHLRQIIVAQNFAPGNAGPWLWTDVLVSLILVVTLAILARRTTS